MRRAPIAVAEGGRRWAHAGDPRPGLGIRDLEVPLPSREGLGVRALPDIDWCDPILPGPFLYGHDTQTGHIQRAYQIGRYPVMHAQFQAFLDDAETGYKHRAWWTEAGWQWKGERSAPDEHNDPTFRLPNHPRIFVRWYEAVAFCNWLTAQIAPEVWAAFAAGTTQGQRTTQGSSLRGWAVGGRTTQGSSVQDVAGLIRLPTEKEWERAARGTDGRHYPWEGDFEPTFCNNSVIQPRIGATSAVGLFPQGVSPCGTHDMSGNVREWCLTQYDSGREDVNGTDVRVLRGGSWYDYGRLDLRAAIRLRVDPGIGDSFVGFRVVRVHLLQSEL